MTAAVRFFSSSRSNYMADRTTARAGRVLLCKTPRAAICISRICRLPGHASGLVQIGRNDACVAGAMDTCTTVVCSSDTNPLMRSFDRRLVALVAASDATLAFQWCMQ